MPAMGEKFTLKSVSVLCGSDQSVVFDSEAGPSMNSVLEKVLKPVYMIKKMSMKTKMTPIEPTFMKMLKSFVVTMMERVTKSTIAQWLVEY